MTLASGLMLPMAEIAGLCRRYQVKELSVFGSAARGDMRPDSDIDLLVEFEPGARISLFRLDDLNEALEALLGRRVDLVTKPALRSLTRPRILAEAKLVYAA
jgi:hypothetical protein